MSGGPFILTSYDYDAPLNELGWPSEPKFSHLSALHAVLTKYASVLLENDRAITQVLGKSGGVFLTNTFLTV
jgi:hypothetical protein